MDKTSFSNNGYQIFLKLKPGISYAQVAPKIRSIEHVETGNINAMSSFVTFQPLSRWHLYSNYVNGKDTPGFLDYVKMFSLIGLLVLIIACINFINLTTARSEKRAREVGVTKSRRFTKKRSRYTVSLPNLFFLQRLLLFYPYFLCGWHYLRLIHLPMIISRFLSPISVSG